MFTVYVYTNIIAGRIGGNNKTKQGYERIIYMPYTVQNSFFSPSLKEKEGIIIFGSK